MTTTIALVTGANKGIGLQTARQLGARGATMPLGARDEERGLEAERDLRAGGADATFVRLDVTDPESVREAADWIEKEHGRLDILVNNAGIARGGPAGAATRARRAAQPYGPRRHARDLQDQRLRRDRGDERDAAAPAPGPRSADRQRVQRGRVDLVDDRPGEPFVAVPGRGLAYPSSKTALNMITVLYARELRDTPIKVNAANPGYTKTDLNGNSGFRSLEEGAAANVHLATLPADGPSGILWGHLWTADAPGALPW